MNINETTILVGLAILTIVLTIVYVAIDALREDE